MSIRKAVIPVAGIGTRLFPATKAQPKEMLPIGRKPVVQYVVDELVAQGLKQILFVTGRKKRSIEDYFDTDIELLEKVEKKLEEFPEEMAYEKMGVNFFYIRQSTPRGLGDAIATAENFIDDEAFVVALGDTVIAGEESPHLVSRMIDLYRRTKASCVIAVEEVAEEDIPRYGIVKAKGKAQSETEEFEIEDLVEKPSVDEAPSNLAIASRYIFQPSIFDAIRRTVPGLGGEIEITDSIKVLINQGHRVFCLRLRENEKRYDIGNYPNYFKAFVDFALEDDKYGYILRQYLRRKLAIFSQQGS